MKVEGNFQSKKYTGDAAEVDENCNAGLSLAPGYSRRRPVASCAAGQPAISEGARFVSDS